MGNAQLDNKKLITFYGAFVGVCFVVGIVIALIFILVMRANRKSNESAVEHVAIQTYIPGRVSYPETIEVTPSEGDLKKELTSHKWDALVTTFDTPGIITSSSRTSATAVFDYDNGTDLNMEITWLTDSQELTLYDWDLNSSLDGYTAKWKNSEGEVRYASFTPQGDGRIDISIYGDESALARFIVLNAPDMS